MASSVPLVRVNSSMGRPKWRERSSKRVVVLGIDAEIGGGEIALDEIDDVRRRADGVFVEIEAELAAAAAGRRMIGRHVEDSAAEAYGLAGTTNLHGAGMRLQTFGAGERGDGGRQFG